MGPSLAQECQAALESFRRAWAEAATQDGNIHHPGLRELLGEHRVMLLCEQINATLNERERTQVRYLEHDPFWSLHRLDLLGLVGWGGLKNHHFLFDLRKLELHCVDGQEALRRVRDARRARLDGLVVVNNRAKNSDWTSADVQTALRQLHHTNNENGHVDQRDEGLGDEHRGVAAAAGGGAAGRPPPRIRLRFRLAPALETDSTDDTQPANLDGDYTQATNLDGEETQLANPAGDSTDITPIDAGNTSPPPPSLYDRPASSSSRSRPPATSPDSAMTKRPSDFNGHTTPAKSMRRDSAHTTPAEGRPAVLESLDDALALGRTLVASSRTVLNTLPDHLEDLASGDQTGEEQEQAATPRPYCAVMEGQDHELVHVLVVYLDFTTRTGTAVGLPDSDSRTDNAAIADLAKAAAGSGAPFTISTIGAQAPNEPITRTDVWAQAGAVAAMLVKGHTNPTPPHAMEIPIWNKVLMLAAHHLMHPFADISDDSLNVQRSILPSREFALVSASENVDNQLARTPSTGASVHAISRLQNTYHELCRRLKSCHGFLDTALELQRLVESCPAHEGMSSAIVKLETAIAAFETARGATTSGAKRRQLQEWITEHRSEINERVAAQKKLGSILKHVRDYSAATVSYIELRKGEYTEAIEATKAECSQAWSRLQGLREEMHL